MANNTVSHTTYINIKISTILHRVIFKTKVKYDYNGSHNNDLERKSTQRVTPFQSGLLSGGLYKRGSIKHDTINSQCFTRQSQPRLFKQRILKGNILFNDQFHSTGGLTINTTLHITLKDKVQLEGQIIRSTTQRILKVDLL